MNDSRNERRELMDALQERLRDDRQAPVATDDAATLLRDRSRSPCVQAQWIGATAISRLNDADRDAPISCGSV